jgi:hypothetical protein
MTSRNTSERLAQNRPALNAARRNALDAIFIWSTNKVCGDLPTDSHSSISRGASICPGNYRGIETLGCRSAAPPTCNSAFKTSAALPSHCPSVTWDADHVLRWWMHHKSQKRSSGTPRPFSYPLRCAMTDDSYTVLTYKGEQVRNNIYRSDVVSAFDALHHAARPAGVYHIGGKQASNCSMLSHHLAGGGYRRHDAPWRNGCDRAIESLLGNGWHRGPDRTC